MARIERASLLRVDAEPGSVRARGAAREAAPAGCRSERRRVLFKGLVATFGRHHADPALAGDKTSLAGSAEMAWMVSEEQERPGRPMKAAAELSTHENVMPTALHPAVVALRGRAHDRARGAGLVRGVQRAPPDAKR